MRNALGFRVFLVLCGIGALWTLAKAEDSNIRTVTKSVIAEPELVSRPAFKVIGISVRTTNKAESDPKTAKIPVIWNRFYGDGVLEQVPNKKNSILGVYTKYESDYTGAYDLIASAEVSSLDQVPSGMVGIDVPAAKYLVFPANGQMPEAIVKGWAAVWDFFSKSTQYQRAYSTDFELYKGPSSADIYIAIK